ncbi:MAG: single-stranded-DNA-specific exonuclease RecJ [Phycisphaerales bacterium]
MPGTEAGRSVVSVDSPSDSDSVATRPTRGLRARWFGPTASPNTQGSLIDRVLAARGLASGTPEAARFLTPSLKDLHDPTLLAGIDTAAERLLRAARDREQIVIYGDYDVDGVTATAILYHTLLTLYPGASIETYVPHRIDEGYGLNAEAIARLADAGARVIVSVDCGITAFEPARVAKARGVDLVITDHHTMSPEAGVQLPDAFACVHPAIESGPGACYPNADLCGAGVAFKLAWRIATLHAGGGGGGESSGERVSPRVRETLLDMLALASLGVIADVMPLVGENRVIARFGLSRMKSTQVEGLHALIDASGMGGERVQADDVGFKLAPRLNACGRMGHAKEAVELLTTATGARARAIAEELTRQNDTRRATERAIFDHAERLATESGMTGKDHRAIVLAHETWHQGVVGIVCSRLVERFHRPTILFQNHGEMCHGSGRSIDGFSLHGAIEACKDHVETFGGHEMAAGLKVRTDRIEAFTRVFTEVCNQRLSEDDLLPRARYDTEAAIADLTLEGVRDLARLAPFGRGNPSVCVRLTGVKIAGRAETFGSGNKHLAIRVSDSRASRSRLMRIVGWNWAARADAFPAGAELELLVRPKISTYGGVSVEPELVDVSHVGMA